MSVVAAERTLNPRGCEDALCDVAGCSRAWYPRALAVFDWLEAAGYLIPKPYA